MKSKQVAALMMAATLAVTGSGVTTMAGQMNAGDEAVVWETESSFKSSFTKDDGELIGTITVTPSNLTTPYGSKMTVKATVTKADGKSYNPNVKPILELVEGADTATGDEPELTTVAGCSYQADWSGEKGDTVETTFTFTREYGKKYFVRATVVEDGKSEKVRVFKCQDLGLKKVDEILKTSDIPSPDFSKGVVLGKGPEAKKAYADHKEALKAIVDKFNENPEIKDKGQWELDEEGNTAVTFTKGAESTLKLKFTSTRYKFTKAGEDTVTVDGTSKDFTRDIKVKVRQLTSEVNVSKADSDKGFVGTGNDTLLLTGTGSQPFGMLKVAFDADSSLDAADPKSVKWETVNNEAGYISISENGDGTITVVGNKVTPTEAGKEVKIIATANEAEWLKEGETAAKSEGFTVKVCQGISKQEVLDSFKICDSEVKDFEYAGGENWEDHYEALLNKLNDKTVNKLAEFGTYSLKTPTTGTAVAVEEKQSVQFEYKIDTKYEDMCINPSADWVNETGKKILSKEYSINVTKGVKDSSNLKKDLGIQAQYVIGTTLETVCKTGEHSKKYTLQWKKKAADGAWTENATENSEKLTTLGSLKDYRLEVVLADADNYTLSGADKEGKLLLSFEDVEVVMPDFTPKVSQGERSSAKGTKYTTGENVELEVDETEIEKSLGAAKDYYALSYQWYKDGKILTNSPSSEKDKITGADTKKITIEDWTIENVQGSYTCEVTATLNAAGKGVEALNGNKAYHTLVRTTEAVPVEVSTITLDGAVATPNTKTYGDNKTSVELSVKATVTGIDSYTVSYRSVNEDKTEGAEIEVYTKQITEEIEKRKFENGFAINYDIKDLDLAAGTYHFYIKVKAGTDENISKAIEVTVNEADVDGTKITAANLSAEPLTYGQSFADVTLKYSGDEKDQVDFKLKGLEDAPALPDAGEYTFEVEAVEKENYNISDSVGELTVKVVVNKAKLSVAAEDLTITEGDKTAKLTAKVSGIAEGGKEADVVTLTPYVTEDNKEDGKKVADISTLPVGVYRIWVKAEVTENALKNYEKVEKSEVGILTVTAKKAEDQKPSTETEQKPGTEQKPSTGTEQKPSTGTEQKPATGTEQKPSTGTEQKPATGTEQTPSTGTEQKPATGTEQTPSTGTEQKPAADAEQKPAKVTAKKVDITLNGQSLSGTVKAKVKATYKLKAQVTLSNNKKNSKVTWTSSNKKIATVNKNGVVKVLNKTGKVKITAKSSYGKSKTITLQVTKSNVKATKIAITGSKTMKVKKSQTLKATVSPATVTNAKVTWKSSNSKIATVNANGKVTAKKKGTVKITATAKDGSKKKAVFTIKVK